LSWASSPDDLVDEPSPRLQRFIRARDQRCGCGKPAAPTDLDHVRTSASAYEKATMPIRT